ncbi:hypothetical protein HYFRA_00005541 [Hymenoscyphus fraxineus]|uniref:DUF6594 domain-containing protein n=1 Tax=Hymenoscyphus fraxineus TaxID=746836 RepID=A0A9N9PQ64_9HELO|nr:hypothetical protein HYFRA_00005541 [Hymenoscyphus fraxineus]
MEKVANMFAPMKFGMAPASCLSLPTYNVVDPAANPEFAKKGKSVVKTDINMKRLSTSKSGQSSKVASAPEDTVAYGRASGAMISEEIDIAIESIGQLDEIDSSAPVSPNDTPIGSSDDGGSSAGKKKSKVVTQKQTYDEKYGYNKLIKRNVESHPLGFPMLSAFQNSGDSVAIFRRFGDTHVRLLLHLEVEITSLEEQLASSDRADSEDTSMRYRIRNEWKEGWDRSKKDLIDKLTTTLLQYGNQSARYTTSNLQRPTYFQAEAYNAVQMRYCSKIANCDPCLLHSLGTSKASSTGFGRGNLLIRGNITLPFTKKTLYVL